MMCENVWQVKSKYWDKNIGSSKQESCEITQHEEIIKQDDNDNEHSNKN